MTAPAPFFVVGLGFVIDHFFWVCCALYGLVLLQRGWRQSAALKSRDGGRPGGVPSIAARLAVRFFLVVGALHVVFAGMGYSTERDARRSAYACVRSWPDDDIRVGVDRSSAADNREGAYYAERCSVVGAGNGCIPEGFVTLLRLHSASTGEVIAEELIANPEGPVRWQSDRVFRYSEDADGMSSVSIGLPPPAMRSELDRFTDKLLAWPR